MPQTGTDFPIHVLALPSVRTYQNNGDGGIANEVIANPLTNRFGGKIVIVYITIAYRLVHNVVSHNFYESVIVFLVALYSWSHCIPGRIVFLVALYSWSHCIPGRIVFLVAMMEADEHPVSRYIGHCWPPSKPVKSSTPAMLASRRL